MLSTWTPGLIGLSEPDGQLHWMEGPQRARCGRAAKPVMTSAIPATVPVCHRCLNLSLLARCKLAPVLIPPRTSLGLSEPYGVLHVLGDGFWSLCGQWCKKIMPQRLAATWPWCPRCQSLEETISRGLMEDVAAEIAEQVVQNFLALPLEERVRTYWLIRQGHPSPPWVLTTCATSPQRPAGRPWRPRPGATS